MLGSFIADLSSQLEGGASWTVYLLPIELLIGAACNGGHICMLYSLG